jgi:hypothetical protein
MRLSFDVGLLGSVFKGVSGVSGVQGGVISTSSPPRPFSLPFTSDFKQFIRPKDLFEVGLMREEKRDSKMIDLVRKWLGF